ncbi:MAG: hypothetical protein FRX49_05060 [Trebouxia sp. A1-2]|nr:MAG: hypothetical protein FRX49_05060 [Trebouxia sp. A1-2]
MGTSAVDRFMRRRSSDLAAALPSSASFTLKFLLQHKHNASTLCQTLVMNRQIDLVASYTIILGQLYLIVLYTVILGQDDLHFVTFLLDSSPQCSDYIPHAPHLERQHKPCLPFNNDTWKGNTSHVCLSTKAPGKAAQAASAFQLQRAGKQLQRDSMARRVHAIHDHQLKHHMESIPAIAFR